MDNKIIEKLETAIAGDDVVIIRKEDVDKLPNGNRPEGVTLSKEDIEALADMIHVWRGVMALGMLTRLARNALFFAASVLALMLWIKGKAPLSEIMKAFGG